ncbi:MAG: RluA family pseudouridine synthase [Acidimicrobiia bacterium]
MSGEPAPDRVVHEVVPAALDGERLDRVVAMLTDRSRAEVAALIGAGAVQVGDRVARVRSARVAAGDEVHVALGPDPGAASLEPDPTVVVPVVYEDEHLLVVDKPAGLVVHPGAGRSTGTLVHGLLARHPELVGVGPDPVRPGIVHRLDKGTSGLLVVARTSRAHAALVAALAAHEVRRRYLALVWGHPDATQGLVDAPIGRSPREPTRMAVTEGGRPARTAYVVRHRFTQPVEVAELGCELETGRTHQIRVHLSSIGHPVVGDDRYGGARPSLAVDRPFLHAEALDLDHPVDGRRLSFAVPPPADLVEVRARLS